MRSILDLLESDIHEFPHLALLNRHPSACSTSKMAPSQNTKSVSRGNSTSPTDKKSSGNGGVMLPTNMGLYVTA